MLAAVIAPAPDGSAVRLERVARGRWLLFVYPLTGEPGVDVPRGWDEIPGARGCSQEACSFRDKLRELQEVGVQEVVALSSDRIQYQQELAARLHLPYRLLSDPELRAADALKLPTFTAHASPEGSGGPQRLYKRLTLVLDGPSIEHVFYPVFPPGPACRRGARLGPQPPSSSA
jgi:peroxiredoxin